MVADKEAPPEEEASLEEEEPALVHVGADHALVKPLTLAIDVGGTGLKASVLDATGAMVADRVRVATKYPLPPTGSGGLVPTLVRRTGCRPVSPAWSVAARSSVRRIS
jgi:hypothetical protein